ncbi:MAG TPA: 16S rRNA (cytidine(1402)-2'-O)-methyltransferase [Gammaproteobacteria bacterium]
MSIRKGILYIVATPIGNLGDMSARAIETLSEVDLIAAEDTRHSLPLLRYFGITTPCIAYHDHNERQLSPELIQRLLHGESIALISDAGTPLINDPGYHLVHQAREAGCQVVSIPGPSALISALSVSGLPTHRFIFEGFLPARTGLRKRRLEALCKEQGTLVFYESSHRILETLRDMVEVFGAGRQAVVAREMTKIHETIQGATLAELYDWVSRDKEQQRGEIVILIQGIVESEVEGDTVEYERILHILMEEMPLKQAVSIAARITGAKRNLLYDLAVKSN